MFTGQGNSAALSWVALEIINLAASDMALRQEGVDNAQYWWGWIRSPLQREGCNGPWMSRIRVKKCSNRAQFVEGMDLHPLSVKCGARCGDPAFLMGKEKMEDAWPTPLLLLAIFLKE